MSEFEIRVSSTPPPQKRQGLLTRLHVRIETLIDTALSRPRASLICGLAAFVLIAGTPHVGWDYRCRHGMDGPGSCRVVEWCAYYGIQGRRIDVPEPGESCKLMTVLPLDYAKLFGGS